MLEYVLICGVFGAAAAMVAHSKARNALGWFIAGFLLGPFSLIVAALPLALKDGHTKRCPQCTEVIRQAAQICRHCGSQAQMLHS
ncbi:MAG: hypothetical protein HY903_21565 [Deltaproteobacteria bacterium]|nr:hypothetical protein [Deltaproteobacteria bacterium]